VPASYLAYLAATFALVVTPGAITAVVVRNTLASGHRAGVLAALGAAVANVVHATLAGLGLWALVGRWPAVLDTMRLGGAAYLAWLGLKSLASIWRRDAAMANPEPGTRSLERGTSSAPFLEALGFNLLNPAIISFYLAVVPTFIPATPPRFYFAVLAATHVSLALLCHTGWATAFHALRQLFARPGVRTTFQLGTAIAMLWLAARVLGRL
jgi:threonine/homoserine/homoserine lactone efflux protein